MVDACPARVYVGGPVAHVQVVDAISRVTQDRLLHVLLCRLVIRVQHIQMLTMCTVGLPVLLCGYELLRQAQQTLDEGIPPPH